MTDGNENAFCAENVSDGLSKREYFAALAMQGFLASYAGAVSNPKPETVASKSIEYANALIEALNNKELWKDK